MTFNQQAPTRGGTKRSLIWLAVGILVIVGIFVGVGIYEHHKSALAACESAFGFDGYNTAQAHYLCQHGQQP